jgi:hypothetical protein
MRTGRGAARAAGDDPACAASSARTALNGRQLGEDGVAYLAIWIAR